MQKSLIHLTLILYSCFSLLCALCPTKGVHFFHGMLLIILENSILNGKPVHPDMRSVSLVSMFLLYLTGSYNLIISAAKISVLLLVFLKPKLSLLTQTVVACTMFVSILDATTCTGEFGYWIHPVLMWMLQIELN